MHVENFKQWGLPQWFRVVTGIVELVGPIALIIGFCNEFGQLQGHFYLELQLL